MKTINVNASGEKTPKMEEIYVYNGQYGIELTHEIEEALLFPEAVKCNVSVSSMFPGTIEEWNNFIKECITEELVKNELVFKGTFDYFLKVN